ncbi:MAG: hypothetical protein NZO58_14480 [Gemmataceae bacterium]|nr:hypothetical protein [Gemmataceae bacterium]
MKRAGLSLLFVGVFAATVQALVVAPPPGPGRLARADAVVVGRIIAHEDQDIEAAFPGSPQKTMFRIAILKVAEGIRGAKEGATLRVAFIPPRPPQPGVPVLSGGGRINLDVGQDGLFILTKHPDGFYQPPQFYHIVARTNTNFDKEVAQVKKLCRLLDDPMGGLKSNDAAERLETAALLVYQYRTFIPGPTKQVPIDADESRLILKAIAEADWKTKRKFGQLHPLELFQMLGLTEKDGWQQPRNIRNVEELYPPAQAWLRDHPDYRIFKIVPAR